MALPVIQQLARDRVMVAYRLYLIGSGPIPERDMPPQSFVTEAIKLVELVMQTPIMRISNVCFVDKSTLYIITDRGFLRCFRHAEATYRTFRPEGGVGPAVDLSLNDRECSQTLSTF